MKPIYICVNGHTFDQPMAGNIMVYMEGGPAVFGCPVCHTEDFEKIPTLEELEKKEPATKTCVTHLGKSIRGDMMISFKCRLCACEFESPISECSLSMTDNAVLHTVTGVNILSTLAAHHKCPSPYCGVECEVTLNKEEIFEEET